MADNERSDFYIVFKPTFDITISMSGFVLRVKFKGIITITGIEGRF